MGIYRIIQVLEQTIEDKKSSAKDKLQLDDDIFLSEKSDIEG